jgi:hypothetical protein
VRVNRTRHTIAPLLRGLIFNSEGRAMSPSHSRGRGGQIYRSYVSQAVLKGGATKRPAIARRAERDRDAERDKPQAAPRQTRQRQAPRPWLAVLAPDHHHLAEPGTEGQGSP